jgi:transposase
LAKAARKETYHAGVSSHITEPLYKLGMVTKLPPAAVTSSEQDPGRFVMAPWQHRNVYERSVREGVPVLVIGKATGHIGLIQGLLDAIVGPLWLMYELVVPHGLGGEAAGRYASNHVVPIDVVRDLLNANYDFFETDARHQIWVTSDPHRSEMLVWDRRDRIFAYGPIEEYEAICRDYGLSEGNVEIPPGLTPNYHAAFDADERRLVAGQDLAWSWTKSPLQPGDDA